MLELWQAEWCPHSSRVRQRLTQLQLDFVARQVAAEPRDRRSMREATGEISIPTLVREDGEPIQGADAIVAWLDETYEEGPEAEAHRAKAASH